MNDTKIEELKVQSMQEMSDDEEYNVSNTSNRLTSVLGNIVWFLLGGGIIFILYALGGILCYITIFGIPFGNQCFKLASLALWPFDKKVVDKPSATGCVSIFMNLLWISFGITIATIHFLFGLVFSITIIGIPWGKQHFKLAYIALIPFGKEIINK